MRKCPKCKSDKVATERRPDGDSLCGECEYKALTAEFDKPAREHTASKDCWCSPTLVGDYRDEGGAEHWMHNQVQ
jgi:uncharacterized Zn finger protein (UPF0148 family)